MPPAPTCRCLLLSGRPLRWPTVRAAALVAAGALALLAGCASRPPLGLTRAEWDALPSTKQAEYRALQNLKESQDRAEAARTSRTIDQGIRDAERPLTRS